MFSEKTWPNKSVLVVSFLHIESGRVYNMIYPRHAPLFIIPIPSKDDVSRKCVD